MLRLVVFLGLLAFSLACKPSTSSSSSGSAGANASGNNTMNAGGKKRAVDQAHVLVETQLKFNPTFNPIFERAFKQGVEQHAHRHGVHYDHNLVYGKTERIGHKFAMGYKIYGADCEEVHTLVFTDQIASTVGGENDAM
uniref:Lipoprotein n=1 Tax=Haemonchus contortus TaxID=6289 RepID=A0A7I4YEY2_HAECO